MDKTEKLFAEAERLLALPTQGREVLRRLTVLRGRLAEEAGVAPFRILSNAQLLSLSERPPAVVGDLGSHQGIGPLLTRAYGAEIVAAARSGASGAS